LFYTFIKSVDDEISLNYAAVEMNKITREAYCMHCINSSSLAYLSYPGMILVSDIAQAWINGAFGLKCPVSDSAEPMPPAEIGPDICFSTLNHLAENKVVKHEKIGAGGFGVVYRGTLETENAPTEVAIKELLLADDEADEDKRKKAV